MKDNRKKVSITLAPINEEFNAKLLYQGKINYIRIDQGYNHFINGKLVDLSDEDDLDIWTDLIDNSKVIDTHLYNN